MAGVADLTLFSIDDGLGMMGLVEEPAVYNWAEACFRNLATLTSLSLRSVLGVDLILSELLESRNAPFLRSLSISSTGELSCVSLANGADHYFSTRGSPIPSSDLLRRVLAARPDCGLTLRFESLSDYVGLVTHSYSTKFISSSQHHETWRKVEARFSTLQHEFSSPPRRAVVTIWEGADPVTDSDNKDAVGFNIEIDHREPTESDSD